MILNVELERIVEYECWIN